MVPTETNPRTSMYRFKLYSGEPHITCYLPPDYYPNKSGFQETLHTSEIVSWVSFCWSYHGHSWKIHKMNANGNLGAGQRF